MLVPIRPSKASNFLGMAVCAIWAGVISYLSGMRGFFAMDQSIVFDGGWRILHGQIPFRDFFLPHGPLCMWIQALAFHALGVNYQVYVLTAATMNVLGAWLAFGTFRALVPEKKWPAWIAGLLTGSWLYAPMGTTYIEQTGFFFLWIAIFAVIRGLGANGIPAWGWMGLAGGALAAAIVAKTNAGLLAAPPLFLMPALLREFPSRRILKDWIGIGIGLVSGLGLFYLWLNWHSDPAAFYHHVVEIAGREGRKRILENKEPHLVICSLFNGKGNDLVRVFTVCAYTLMGLSVAWVLGPYQGRPRATKIRRFGFLSLLWIAYQHGFGVTSNNNGINEQPFLGLIFVSTCLGVSEMAAAVSQKSTAAEIFSFFRKSTVILLAGAALFTAFFFFLGIRGMGNYDFSLGVLLALGVFRGACAQAGEGITQRRILGGLGGVVLGALFWIGTSGSYSRQAQDFFNNRTRFVAHDDIPILRGLAWAEEVNEDAREMHPTWEEFAQTWQVLKDAPGRFYLLGNYTILYAATGKPSMGPLSWFFRGLTYSWNYDPVFDERFATQVDQPDVIYFVTEEDFALKYKLADFPALARVLRQKYRPEKKIGPFHLYRRLGTEHP